MSCRARRCDGQQRRAVKRLVDLARRADEVRELEPERPGRSESLHQPIDRIDGGLPHLRREVRVHLRGPGAGVPEVHLDETEVHAVLQEMGGVRMPQRVYVSPDPSITAGAGGLGD